MTSDSTYPSYLRLFESGELEERASRARALMARCNVCPRACGVDRLKDERGECGIGLRASVSSVGPHFGEESPLVGRRGSGTVFFAGCNLACSFCQNYDISQLRHGRDVDGEELASLFLRVQGMGCHNLNLVTPSHVVPQAFEALVLAVDQGFRLPIVYNSGGYDSIRTLRLLDGVVDIYMPDAKYGNSGIALRLSGIRSYWEVSKKVLLEMHRQVGDLVVEDGIARRGLLVRHLVLPEGLAGTNEVMRFLGEEVSKDTWANVMEQYRPCYRADEHSELRRRITDEEYRKAVEIACSYGIHRGFPFDLV
jgi:putative pyruvate formate lyase activating enzyme